MQVSTEFSVGGGLEMAEKIKKSIGTLGCEDARSYHSKYNIRKKLVLSKLISTCPEEHFQRFVLNLKLFFGFEAKFFGRVVNTAFHVSRGTFWFKKVCQERDWFSDFER